LQEKRLVLCEICSSFFDDAFDRCHGGVWRGRFSNEQPAVVTFDRHGNALFGSQGGIWKSSKTDSGYTWTNVLKNPNTSAGKGLARDANGNLYYGHNQDKMDPTVVYRSTDDGKTWSAYDAGIPPSLQARQFAVNPADADCMPLLSTKLPTVAG
jgi:hypothetical protein